MGAKFPPPPTSQLDWGTIGFAVQKVNGHVEARYSTKTGGEWSDPTFVEDPYLRVHGLATGLNYGQQCFEGIKAFRAPGDGSIHIFRPRQNVERMAKSAAFVSMPPVPTKVFMKCLEMAVARNAVFVPPHDSKAALYIRPLLFGSSAHLGLSACEDYTFVVYVNPVGVYHGTEPVAALILEDIDRTAPEGSGAYKVGGNYAPIMRFSTAARADGYNITLHLDSKTRTEIDEFSTSAFIGVKQSSESGKPVLVVPDSKNTLMSITADSACAIACSWGWTVERRAVYYQELKTFDEVMAAGTAATLVPVKSITMKSRNEAVRYGHGGQAGPITIKLLTKLKAVQSGDEKDEWGWLHQVSEP
ncbi:branched-chain amino acid aminotransferase II [Piedraia hortae CBS 480.64]|uniref:Branched-chain amino acid aminotransferase II n=1 Tax=Piedraia hortae CBS 480.64 TaxID=1314780 RepID=A0A6A7C7V1_9PEZI|nr:branched-chain amino acid aminotransferase II [Piedraia hortae CBS 480.64]